MRAHEEKKGGSLLAMNMKARTVVGGGDKSLSRGHPGSELRLGREKEKMKVRR